MPTSSEVDAKDRELRLEMVRRGLWKSCLNCEHWGEVEVVTSTERVYNQCCKYRMLPPDEVIVVGCPEHIPDIPF